MRRSEAMCEISRLMQGNCMPTAILLPIHQVGCFQVVCTQRLANMTTHGVQVAPMRS
jgi:hypothetical protein